MTKRYGMGKENKGTSPILLDKAAARQLPEGAKKASEEAEEAKKISEFAKGKAVRPINKKVKN